MDNNFDAKFKCERSKTERDAGDQLFPAIGSSRSRSLTRKLSPNVETQSTKTISPFLTFPHRQEIAQLRSHYSEINERLENEHEQQMTLLQAEWKQLALERIRFQRLTLDYEDESHYLRAQIHRLNGQLSDNLHDHKQLLFQRRQVRLDPFDDR